MTEYISQTCESVASVAAGDKPIRAHFYFLSLSCLSMQQFPLAADVNVTFPAASQGASEPLNQLTGQITHPSAAEEFSSPSPTNTPSGFMLFLKVINTIKCP